METRGKEEDDNDNDDGDDDVMYLSAGSQEVQETDVVPQCGHVTAVRQDFLPEQSNTHTWVAFN